jgi:hypothetical protein
MKTLFAVLFLSTNCFSQNKIDNYIKYNNYASEGEYYFHEKKFDSAVYYYQKGWAFVNEPHPSQRYKYAKALWKINEKKKALEELIHTGMSSIDTNWFSGLDQKTYNNLLSDIKKIDAAKASTYNYQFYNSFFDSIFKLDQFVRLQEYPNDSIKRANIRFQDSCNSASILQFTREHGFPAGKNAGWNQPAAIFFLHMSPEWYIENYVLLYQELIKGNIEPWMLASGIDRMFAVQIGEEKINPYNLYWEENVINPFLMFYNCVSLGVSPYYTGNHRANPKKTIHFEYYKENKNSYNTCFQYN